jgi:hypothetical protein
MARSALPACALLAIALGCAACGSSGSGASSTTSSAPAGQTSTQPGAAHGSSVISAVKIAPDTFAPAGVTKPTGGVSKGAIVSITLTKATKVRLITETPLGKEVDSTPAASLPKGSTGLNFTGRDEGQPLASGNYRLVAELVAEPKLGPVQVEFTIL